MTCDAWQASNADAYFAVTGHWIEECKPGNWALQSSILGFVQLNTTHNGAKLGQALFKICERVGITHKVCSISMKISILTISNRLAILPVTMHLIMILCL